MAYPREQWTPVRFVRQLRLEHAEDVSESMTPADAELLALAQKATPGMMTSWDLGENHGADIPTMEVSARSIKDLLRRLGEAETRLSALDSLVARRPALADEPTLYAKVSKCIKSANEMDAACRKALNFLGGDAANPAIGDVLRKVLHDK